MKKARLESLDVLRGFDMFFIFLPDPVPCIVLTFLAMFGNFAGEILIGGGQGEDQAKNTSNSSVHLHLSPSPLFSLILLSAGLLVAGLLMAFAFGSWSIPVNKPIWSSSFALVAGGISTGLLALFHWIVDVKGWRRWGFFFKVIGMNAITLYLLVRTVFNWNFESQYFFGGLASLLPPAVGAFVTQSGMIALLWLFLYLLYRKNIFLRV